MSMKARIQSVLNKFMGIEVHNATLEKDRWIIDTTSSCPNTLSCIIRKVYKCNGLVGVYSPDSSEFIYWLSVPEDSLQAFLYELEETAADWPPLTEMMGLIDRYHLLDTKGKKKYLQFVKYLRRQDLIGYEELSASELLKHYREDYGSYTKADEVRAILEFNSPQKALEALITDPVIEPDDN